MQFKLIPNFNLNNIISFYPLFYLSLLSAYAFGKVQKLYMVQKIIFGGGSSPVASFAVLWRVNNPHKTNIQSVCTEITLSDMFLFLSHFEIRLHTYSTAKILIERKILTDKNLDFPLPPFFLFQNKSFRKFVISFFFRLHLLSFSQVANRTINTPFWRFLHWNVLNDEYSSVIWCKKTWKITP